MNNNMISGVPVLVYDRWYCSRPRTALLAAKRIFLTAIFCVSSMLYILAQYDFPVSMPDMAAVCGVSCVLFMTLFICVKRRYAVPAVLAAAGLLVYYNFEQLAARLTFFFDACMLLVEGRFLYPRRYLFHTAEQTVLSSNNPEYVEGVLLGSVLLCIAYSFVISACFSGKPAPIPAALVFAALCVPPILSERLELSLWLIPALASLAALAAIGRNYTQTLSLLYSPSAACQAGDLPTAKAEERVFFRRIASFKYRKRLKMTCNYRMKYFSTGMYCAALVSVCLLIGASIVPEGGSIDYTEIYNFIVSLGSSASTLSPFEDGAASEYFAQKSDADGQTEVRSSTLNIISPGRGERQIISVTYTGSRPIYLRGDIGVDFNGTSWTTAVEGGQPAPNASTDETASAEAAASADSRQAEMVEGYRPCENRVIAAMISAKGGDSEQDALLGEDGLPIITSSEINIEYLCNTSVVFLPPYTADYSFYDNEDFEVYGDFTVRVSSRAGGRVNSVQCTALIPSYTSNELNAGDPSAISAVEALFEDAGCEPNDIYSTVVPEMTEENVLSDYEEYVEEAYLGIPEEYSADIEEYIDRALGDTLDEIKSEYSGGALTKAEYRYSAASAVADYLRDNYTYTLSGVNNGESPVLQFLNETKRGHCSLYASAMTLILRECGIPARYCTGFYVESAGDGKAVVLREKNLHAWVEVYLGQYGWVTFDPTSSSALSGVMPDETSESDPTADTGDTESADALSEEGLTSAATAEITGETKDKDAETIDAELQQSGQAQSLDDASPQTEESGVLLLQAIRPFIPALIAVLAVAAVIAVLAARISRLKRRARQVLNALKVGGSSDGCRRAERAFRLILRLLEYKGFTPQSGEFFADFFARCDAALGTNFAGCADALEGLEFGGRLDSPEKEAEIVGQLMLLVDVLKPFRFPYDTRALRIIINSRWN